MGKNLRAIDQEAFSGKDRGDFRSRSHKTTQQNATDLITGIIIVTVGTMILLHYKTMLGALICLLMGVALLIYVKRAAKQKLVIERSEFLNALLSSAIGSKHEFAMIVTQKDGQIVYLNHGFQSLFPKMLDANKRYLNKLLKAYSTSDAKSKTILAAVDKATDKSVALEVKGKGKEKIKLKFKIEPIARPSGFIMIRGE